MPAKQRNGGVDDSSPGYSSVHLGHLKGELGAELY